MKRVLFLLIFFLTLTIIGQTKQLIGVWGFNKDVNQLNTLDTLLLLLLLSHTDLLLLKNYTFNKNGDFEICNEPKLLKAKGRTAECVWNKIGTWTYIKPILSIILEHKSMNLFINKLNKRSGRLQVLEIINGNK